MRGVDRIVHRVVSERGSDFARTNSAQRRRSSKAPILERLKEHLSRVRGRIDVGECVAVSGPESREGEALERIARGNRESLTVLPVVLRRGRVNADLLVFEDRQFLLLIVYVASTEDSEAGRNGPIEKIGLGETEEKTGLPLTQLSGQREGCSQAEEVVRLIGKAAVAPGQSAQSPLQSDRLFPLLLELQIDVHRAFLGIPLDFGVLRLDLLEIVELVKPQDADFPSPLVKELALVDQHFPPDNLVASDRVSCELDAADVVHLLLVELEREINVLVCLVDIEDGFGSEIDKPVLAVDLLIVLECLPQFSGGENVAVLEREEPL